MRTEGPYEQMSDDALVQCGDRGRWHERPALFQPAQLLLEQVAQRLGRVFADQARCALERMRLAKDSFHDRLVFCDSACLLQREGLL